MSKFRSGPIGVTLHEVVCGGSEPGPFFDSCRLAIRRRSRPVPLASPPRAHAPGSPNCFSGPVLSSRDVFGLSVSPADSDSLVLGVQIATVLTACCLTSAREFVSSSFSGHSTNDSGLGLVRLLRPVCLNPHLSPDRWTNTPFNFWGRLARLC